MKALHLIAFLFHFGYRCLMEASCYIQPYQQTHGVFCQKEMPNVAWKAIWRTPSFTKQINKWRVSSRNAHQNKIALPQGRGYKTVFTKSSLRKLWDNTQTTASHKVKGKTQKHTHTHTHHKQTISTVQCVAHHIIDKGQKPSAGKRGEHRESDWGEDATEMSRTDNHEPWRPCHRNHRPVARNFKRCAWE